MKKKLESQNLDNTGLENALKIEGLWNQKRARNDGSMKLRYGLKKGVDGSTSSSYPHSPLTAILSLKKL